MRKLCEVGRLPVVVRRPIGRNRSLQVRRGRSPARRELAVEEAHQLLEFRGRLEVLGEEIAWILLTSNLAQLEFLPPSLLELQAMAFNVPQFAQALA